MKSNPLSFKFHSFLAVVFILFFTTCGKKEEEKKEAGPVPILSTVPVTEITEETAKSGGLIGSDGGSIVLRRGICWSDVKTNPTTADAKTEDGDGAGLYVSSMAPLQAGKKYYVRAYAVNANGTGYGSTLSFETSPAGAPVVFSGTSATEITYNSAKCTGGVSSGKGAEVTERGICYKTQSSWWGGEETPTTADSKAVAGSGLGNFEVTLTGLDTGVRYFARAYAINAKGTSYGDVFSFTTRRIELGTVSTGNVSDVSSTSAKVRGTVLTNGGGTITSRGFRFGLNNPPYDSTRVVGSGMGSFESELTNLRPGKSYFVQAFCTNKAGTSYGTVVGFNTTPAAPKITITDAQNLTPTSVQLKSMFDCGGPSFTISKIYYSKTNTEPTTAEMNVNVSTFNCSGTAINLISGLTPNTVYYARSYSATSFASGYGNVFTFTTPPLSTNGAGVTDIDGNFYPSKILNGKEWMAENLKVTRLNDGTDIANPTTSWWNITTPAYCWVDNNVAYKDLYGGLYNFYASNTTKLCPVGWHVPTEAEVNALVAWMGNNNVGGALKSTTNWNNPNTGATNESGLSAVPAGLREGSSFNFRGLNSRWQFLSTTDQISTPVKSLLLSHNNSETSTSTRLKEAGVSVRCVKD